MQTSNHARFWTYLDRVTKIATVVVLIFAIYSILQAENTIKQNKDVVETLTEQVKNLEKIIQLQRASVVNSYSEFEPSRF